MNIEAEDSSKLEFANRQHTEAMPKISIVMPSFNQGQYLEAAILSILGQEYPNFELVVIDGGSTDNSSSILQAYSDHIFRWSSEPDEGQSDALNKGFEVITGDIVGWLNSDDTYEPGTLYEVAEVFTDNTINIVMCSKYGLMDSEGTVFGHMSSSFKTHAKLIRYWATKGMTINQPSVFFRRQIVNQFQPVFDKTLHYAMDYDLWLRLTLDHKIHVVEGYWANYRFHETSKSGQGFGDFFPEWDRVSRRFWGKKGSLSWWLNLAGSNVFGRMVRTSRGFLRKIKHVIYE